MKYDKCIPIIKHDDERLFDYLNVFKFIDMKFVQKHLYKSKSRTYIYTRIQQLEYFDFINHVTLYEVNAKSSNTNSKKVLYSGELSKEVLEYNYYNTTTIREVHSHYINHQLLLANALVYYYDLEGKVSDSSIKVVKLLTEQELSLSERKINVRPDAGLVLEINGRNILFFVEAERSYAKEIDVARKLKVQYNSIDEYYYKIDVFTDYDIQGVRVLFISSSRNKMNNLILKCKKFTDLKIDLLFTSLEDINSEIDHTESVLNLTYNTIHDKRIKLYEKI